MEENRGGGEEMPSNVEGICSLFITRVNFKNGTRWEILQCYSELNFDSAGALKYLFWGLYIHMRF